MLILNKLFWARNFLKGYTFLKAILHLEIPRFVVAKGFVLLDQYVFTESIK